jgi:hypothetical protein
MLRVIIFLTFSGYRKCGSDRYTGCGLPSCISSQAIGQCQKKTGLRLNIAAVVIVVISSASSAYGKYICSHISILIAGKYYVN